MRRLAWLVLVISLCLYKQKAPATRDHRTAAALTYIFKALGQPGGPREKGHHDHVRITKSVRSMGSIESE